jgi:hypothetical protein
MKDKIIYFPINFNIVVITVVTTTPRLKSDSLAKHYFFHSYLKTGVTSIPGRGRSIKAMILIARPRPYIKKVPK